MKAATQTIPAGEFKAKCLQLMNEVNTKHITILVTKRGKAVAKLVPVESGSQDNFGCLAGSVTIHDDITQPLDVDWEANND